MLGGLGFVLAALFSMASTIGLGGVFVVMAWVQVLEMRAANGRCRVPAALYAFTASVCVDLLVFIGIIIASCNSVAISRNFPDLLDYKLFGVILVDAVWFFSLVVSFCFLIVSIVLVRRESGPGIRIMKIGSRILFITSLLGLIGIIAWLPGAPWYQSTVLSPQTVYAAVQRDNPMPQYYS